MHAVLSASPGQLPVDATWFRDVNAFSRATAWLHAPMAAYATYGVALFALVLLGGWWIARSRGDLRAMTAALWAPLGTLLAVGLNQPLAGAVAEPRPYRALPHVLVLVTKSADYSFPSDHAVMAGAVTAGVFLVSRRLGLVSLVLALLIAFARVYVGAHFPGDVLAGLVYGAAVSLVGYLVVRALLFRVVVGLDRTPLRLLVTSEPVVSDRTKIPADH